MKKRQIEIIARYIDAGTNKDLFIINDLDINNISFDSDYITNLVKNNVDYLPKRLIVSVEARFS